MLNLSGYVELQAVRSGGAATNAPSPLVATHSEAPLQAMYKSLFAGARTTECAIARDIPGEILARTRHVRGFAPHRTGTLLQPCTDPVSLSRVNSSDSRAGRGVTVGTTDASDRAGSILAGCHLYMTKHRIYVGVHTHPFLLLFARRV